MRKTLLLGAPGCGKTTRLLGVMEKALNEGVPSNRIAFTTFTRAAAGEAKARAKERFGLSDSELPYFRTLHSLAFNQLGAKRSDILAEEHLGELAELTGELVQSTGASAEAPASRRSADGLMTIDHYARTTRQDLKAAWYDHGGDTDWFRLKRFSEAYRLYKSDRGLTDFTDLLSDYITARPPPVPIDLAIVDEAQDLTLLQWAVADHAFSNAGELWVAGDDDQCQPAGTLVTTANRGDVPIESLRPEADQVVTYCRDDGMMYRRDGKPFKIAARDYTGDLYTLTTGDHSTACTQNHRWYVKWRPEAKNENWNVVYLMKKGRDWRVGWCQLFRSDGILHLNHRANRERADAVWILRIFKDKREAFAYEQVVSARYGIPMLPFHAQAASSTRMLSQDAVDDIFAQIDSAVGARRALADNHKLEAFPFIDRLKPNYSRFGNAINEVVVCNLWPELLTVPIYTGDKKPIWQEFSVARTHVHTTVYSLDVEQHHTYVADGIVTHNSIHRWAGAAEDHMFSLSNYDREVLPLSHRLPREIFELSQEVIRQVGQRYPKDTAPADRSGTVNWLARPDEVNLSSGTWLLLSRTRAQLTALVELARGQGVTYRLKGASSIDAEYVRAIVAYEALRAGKRVEGAEVILAMRAAGVSAAHVMDSRTYTAKELNFDAGPIWHDALIRLPLDLREYYLMCLRRDPKSLTTEPRIRIDTIHGSKGAEAEHVLLTTDLTWQTQRGYELDPDSEHRVFYVGITRASQSLWLVAPRGAYRYPL